MVNKAVIVEEPRTALYECFVCCSNCTIGTIGHNDTALILEILTVDEV